MKFLRKNIINDTASSFMEDVDSLENDLLNKKSIFDIITINNITITQEMLDDMISEIIFTKDNLEYVFLKSTDNLFDYQNMLKTFIPTNINEPSFNKIFLKKMKDNRNYYSFFAEALMSIALRDIMGFNLVSAVLDTTRTLIDSETGVDACMIDYKKNKIILGEAKFYEKLTGALRQIDIDFSRSDSILNKLDNLLRNIQSNIDAKHIVVKELLENKFYNLSINDLFRIKFVFSGFVLHERGEEYNEEKIVNICKNKFSDINKIIKNIECKIGEIEKENIEIIIFNLPTNSKKNLINKIINKAKENLEGLYNEGVE